MQTKRVVITICSIIGGGLAAALIILLLLLTARNIQKNKNETRISELKNLIDAKKSVEVDTLTFNTALSEADAIKSKRILISQLFDRLTEALPKEVYLTNITVDPTYKVKASVSAPEFNTVDLFGNALLTYNTGEDPRRNIDNFPRKTVFTDIKIDAVTTDKTSLKLNSKTFDVTFQVDKDLVQKFRNDTKVGS